METNPHASSRNEPRMSQTATPLEPVASRESSRRPGWALAVLAAAQLVLVLDGTVVNVALPSIQETFAVTETSLVWITQGYALAFGGLLLLGGRMSDLYGRRRMFTIGMSIFAVSSLFAGLAPNEGLLILARMLMGAAAAIVSPAAFSLLTRLFTDTKGRAKALAVWGAMAGMGGVLGLLIGGALVEFLSWRWIFLINLPFAVATLVLLPRLVSESREDTRTPLDVLGAVLVTSSISLAVYALLEKGTAPWSDPTLLSRLGASLALMAVFVWWESRYAHPMVPLRLFRSRNRSTATVVSVLLAVAMATMFFSLSLYMQQVLGLSPLTTGVAYLPFVFGIVVSTQIAGRLVPKVGIRPLMPTGLVMGAIGQLILSTLQPDGGYWIHIFPGLLIMGLGAGLVFTNTSVAAVDGTTDVDAGIASSINNAAAQVGAAIGLAALVAVAVEEMTSQQMAGVAPDIAAVAGFSASFHISALLLLVSGVLAALLLGPLQVPVDEVVDVPDPTPQPAGADVLDD